MAAGSASNSGLKGFHGPASIWDKKRPGRTPARRGWVAQVALGVVALLGVTVASSPAGAADRQGGTQSFEETQVSAAEIGHRGGSLTITERSEPKTLNPVLAVDVASRDVIRRMTADLVHINRQTLATEPALGKSWKRSGDGRAYTIELRRGLRFSDGHPCDADDVLFSFEVYLDEKLGSPQRDLLVIDGQPIRLTKLDAYTVRFDLPKPYAAAERIFDSIAILPRHLLEASYRQGKLGQAWALQVDPSQIAGLGPYRLKEYVPGQRLVLERNPYYWKVDGQGQRLPYLDQIVFPFVANEDAQAMRFQSGESDVINSLSSESYNVLAKSPQAGRYNLYDLGPGLEFNFLFFNLNDLAPGASPKTGHKRAWFRALRFRQAVSAAIDREDIVRLVYRGRGRPLWSHDTEGDRLWVDRTIPRPRRSLDRARTLLKEEHFSWKSDGTLVDQSGQSVEFSIIASSSNSERLRMATLVQDDLAQLGMQVHVVPLEFRAVLTRLFDTHDYDACVLGVASGDVDPNPGLNIWLSSGGMHVWHPSQTQPATPWEAEIDRLMKQQMTTLDSRRRKQLYDRVQELVAENLPVICLASPDILVGAKRGLGNFKPAILDHYTLWNADELFWRGDTAGSRSGGR